jgi:hypothetical protein
VYAVAKEHLLVRGYVEFRRVLKDADVYHDINGVEEAFPLIRRMLMEETHRELMCGSAVYFEDLKKAHHAIDGHGRKLDPKKYLAINNKARGWIWVGRDVDGDIVEAHLHRCRVQERGWRDKQDRIRSERYEALSSPVDAANP